MGDKTGIQWTEATWNPTVGCSLVSPGCTNCYAMKQAYRIEHGFKMGQKYDGTTKLVNGHPVWTGVVKLDEATLDQPLRWKRPRRIFVNSMSDLFHESLPDEAIDRVFAVMALAPQHTFQVLTKRAERMRSYANDAGWKRRIEIEAARLDRKPQDNLDHVAIWPLPNVWLGVSVEDQPRADERVSSLCLTPAAVRFLSCEPLLGPIDLHRWMVSRKPIPLGNGQAARYIGPGIDWVIVGGESGPGARPFDLEWGRSILAQCKAAGVPCFMKQLGAATGFNLHDRKGGDWNEWPADLRVREFPNAPLY